MNNLRPYNLQQMGVDALVTHKTFGLGLSDHPNLQPDGDVFTFNGRVMAAKQPGQFVLGAVPYAVMSVAGVTYDRDYDLAAALVTWLSTGLLSALSLAYLDCLLWSLWGFSRPASLAATCMVGAASTWIAYSGIAHHDIEAAALIVLGLYAMEQNRIESSGQSKPRAVFAGALLGLALFVSMLPAVIVAVLGASMLLWRPFRVGIVLCNAGGFLLGVLPLLAHNFWYFGNPLLPANIAGNFADTFPRVDGQQALHHLNAYLGLGGISLWKYAPGLTLGAVGLWLLPSKLARARSVLLVALAGHLAYLLSIETLGTCTYGPRYLIPALPLLAPGVAALLDRPLIWVSGAARWFVAGALFAYGFLINAVGAVQGTMNCNLDVFALWGRIPGINQLTAGHFPVLWASIGVLVLWPSVIAAMRVATSERSD